MPRGDRTGPNGIGPMTGRGAGFCAGFDVPGFFNRGTGFFRRGIGAGIGLCGLGYGIRHWFRSAGLPGSIGFGRTSVSPQEQNPATEKQTLKNQVNILQSQLDSLTKRLSELENENKSD